MRRLLPLKTSMPSSKLETILDTLTTAESRLIPVFIHNPNTQRIAALAFVGEQFAIGLFKQLAPGGGVSTPAPAAAPDPSTRIG